MALATLPPFFGENLTLDLLARLESRGWAHAPGALDAGLVGELRAECVAMAAAGALKTARIGRGEALAKDTGFRKTQIAWLDGSTPAQRAFLDGAEALRLQINRALYAGLFEFEAHFAAYPEGGFYKRHLDAFTAPVKGSTPAAVLGRRAERSRIVSLVAYLDDAWTPGDGGELAVWEHVPLDADGRPDLDRLDGVPPAAILEPRAGSLVLMMSEQIPHEVRPAFAPRHAIAGWWRVNASLGGIVDPGR
ncbi:2OG-Fe(II) oxygenase [Marinicauda algicola]|uniref:2OG-Fe(II) oxygenase n=1 Tax=Marinicauda algicola TaxID=2029849 RepID=A0A4S2H1I5_9PROT|nr:2OG-Fe(II) oxygenase [Marinicauda algicola]TGY89324.1 2OG-Fe(II) oxygenase [Marinicauda algicola]